MTYKDIITDANNLYKAYLATIDSSKWKESTQIFRMFFLRWIFKLQDELINQTIKNRINSEFELRERGKIRPITSIPTDGRMIRHVLCDEIFLPIIKRKIIYDNGASVKGRGITFQRKRFEIHLRRYIRENGLNGWIIFSDFRKFYDNIVHELAINDLLKLVNYDPYIEWLLSVIFDGFRIDVSHLTDEEYNDIFFGIFDKLKYRESIRKVDQLSGVRYMPKSVNIGDQLSQVIGIYFPHDIDNYIKYVRQQKYYGRYSDDWYIISRNKEELLDIFQEVKTIADRKMIHINEKKTCIIKIDKTMTFLQIKYIITKEGKIIKRIKSKKVTDFRRKLRKLYKKLCNNAIPYSNIENMFKSWMGNFYKLITRKQRKNLLELYEELFNKNIEIKNKKMIITNR